jgi:hypothetical protein
MLLTESNEITLIIRRELKQFYENLKSHERMLKSINITYKNKTISDVSVISIDQEGNKIRMYMNDFFMVLFNYLFNYLLGYLII